MATPDAIRDLGDTLLFLLCNSDLATMVDANRIIISKPDEFGPFQRPPNPTVTIFLYRIALSSEMRNAPPRTLPDGRVTRASLPLELYYLITPWATVTRDEHRILGRIMQVLYDNAELGPAQLQGDSWGPGDSVQIMLDSLPLDDHYRIWDSTNLPYRLSLTYLVRIIGIEPAEVFTQVPVVEARFGKGTP